jgi:hypothetical protein
MYGALVSLVQDDDTVVVELVVQQALPEQHAVCHVLDVCRRARAILKTDGVAHLEARGQQVAKHVSLQ